MELKLSIEEIEKIMEKIEKIISDNYNVTFIGVKYDNKTKTFTFKGW